MLFYASWCTHCQNIIPKIYELYQNQEDKTTEVVAISLDTSKTEWNNFIGTYALDWINIGDMEGWNSKVAKEYFIYATPTMFLIAKDKKLIAKPTSVNDLKPWF